MSYNIPDKIIFKNSDIEVSGTYTDSWDKSLMIDGDTSSTYGWQPLADGVGGWASFNLNRSVKDIVLKLLFHKSVETFYPKELKVQGYNGNNWVDEKNLSIDNSNMNWHEFTLKFSRAYSKIRLYIVSTHGQRPVFREVEIYDFPPLNKTLILHDGEYKKFLNKSATDGTSNVIPIMTSDRTPSGIASASSVYSADFPAWKAFNGTSINNLDTWASLDNQSENWLQYEFPNEIIIKKYAITGYNLTGYELYNPQNWRFEGYNTTSNTWDILDIQSNQTFVMAQAKEYEIASPKAYKKYRLYITAMNNSTRVVVSELKMFEMQSHSIWSTVSSTLPTQEKFLSEGIDSLSPLLDRRVETFEPQKMNADTTTSESGKIFSKTLNLNKYIDIRSIKVDVK